MLVIQTKIAIKYTVKLIKSQYIGNLKTYKKILQYYYGKGGFVLIKSVECLHRTLCAT